MQDITRETKEFTLYNVWNRSGLNEVWVKDKPNKTLYLVKYGSTSGFDLSYFLFKHKICNVLKGTGKKSFVKVHEDDFYSRMKGQTIIEVM